MKTASNTQYEPTSTNEKTNQSNSTSSEQAYSIEGKKLQEEKLNLGKPTQTDQKTNEFYQDEKSAFGFIGNEEEGFDVIVAGKRCNMEKFTRQEAMEFVTNKQNATMLGAAIMLFISLNKEKNTQNGK